nr:UBX domain-containing protein 1-like isoform X1 [Procambarus clarkii]
MTALQTLMEMGFSENSAKKALAVTGGGGIEQAMEWLLAHADDPGINDPPAEAEAGHSVGSKPDEKMETDVPEGQESVEEKGSGEGKETGVQQESGEGKSGEGEDETNEGAKSIKCDDCGKLFKSSEEVEFHAIKSGHSNFSESTEEKKPLTAEEKQEKKRLLEEKIKQRRKEREQEEEKEARDRERKRIQMGQEITERKRIMQEQEMKRIAEDRRREKLEDKIARQKVKDQIERDRLARKEMFANKGEGGSQATVAPPKPQPTPVPQPTQKKEYTTARLQIRLPSGTPLVQEFKAKEALSAVRLWIGLNRQDGLPADAPFKLSTSFPRKVFSDEDMDKPLDVLGLVPSAVIMVSK